MKKFLLKFIIFILPMIFLIISTEFVLRKIPNNYILKNDFLNTKSENLEVLFLGNSHIFFGINPKFVKKKSFNAANISQTLDLDLQILRKYETKFKNLKYIVLPIDYISLYCKLSDGAESWRLKNYNLYYGLNTNLILKDYSEVLTNNFEINKGRINLFYFKKIQTITCTNLGWGTENNSSNKQDLDKTGIKAAERHLIKDFKYFNDNVNTISKFIEIAKKKNIKVLLISPPAYHSYTDVLNKAQWDKTLTVANLLVRKYQNVIYKNFMTDSTFVQNDFFDADHLNEIGAEKFSKKINSIIK